MVILGGTKIQQNMLKVGFLHVFCLSLQAGKITISETQAAGNAQL